MDENVPDQELVKEALARRDAFAHIVARYDNPLRRYIARIGAIDPESVKDLLQETFIRAYVHLNDYDPSLPLSAWLYRVAHNEVMTHFRKQKNRPHAFLSEDYIEIFERIASDLTTDTVAETRIQESAVRTALELLPLKYREVLILRFFEERSYEEISDILEIPNGTVGVVPHSRKKTAQAASKTV